MPKRGDWESASDIAEAIRRINAYIKGFTYSKFLGDTKTQDAVARNLEIIGEAARNISAEFRKKHKDIAWKNIAGMRNKLIHEYFGVNWDVVWDVATLKLPELEHQIGQILNRTGRNKNRR